NWCGAGHNLSPPCGSEPPPARAHRRRRAGRRADGRPGTWASAPAPSGRGEPGTSQHRRRGRISRFHWMRPGTLFPPRTASACSWHPTIRWSAMSQCMVSVSACSASVSVRVRLANLSGNYATVADLVAILLRPGANTPGLRRTGPAAGLSTGGLPAAGTACGADPWCQRFAEIRSVLGVQVNLICDAVQCERHRFFSIRSIDIIDQEDANLLCHRYSLSVSKVVTRTTVRLQH